MYHRFSPEGRDHPRRMSAREFAWQLEYLARHHRGWSPDEQLDAAGRPLPAAGGPPVVITVDDGYEDFGTVAFPLLRRHGLPAVVFLTTGFVAGRLWFWWDKLIWVLENSAPGHREFQVAGLRAAGDPARPEELWSLWNALADQLNPLGHEEREAALADLAAREGLAIPAAPPPPFRALNWDQVRGMMSQGISFGAHTLSHPPLSRLAAADAEREIRASGDEIAAATGAAPSFFCFPHGDFREETLDLVVRAGFRGCYAAFPEPRHDGDPFTLPRYSMSGDRLAFQWILCGAEHLSLLLKTRGSNRKGTVWA